MSDFSRIFSSGFADRPLTAITLWSKVLSMAESKPGAAGQGEVVVVVEVSGLRKRYGSVEAVAGVDRASAAGQVRFTLPAGVEAAELPAGWGARWPSRAPSSTSGARWCCAIGRVFYGVAIPGATVVGFVATLVVGSATFSAIGIAVTRVIPTETAAPAVANAVSLPLFFISGIFVPVENIPEWLLAIADVFPLEPFADALFVAFDPATSGLGFSFGDLAVVAAWGLVAVGLAARTFAWVPRRG